MGGVSTPTMHESPGALEDSGVHTITNSMHTNDLLFTASWWPYFWGW